MTKPENDAELSQLVVNVQHIASGLDAVTRERGIGGLANELSTLYAAVREADWRAHEIMGPWWKRFLKE
jgi:hypothetical protein